MLALACPICRRPIQSTQSNQPIDAESLTCEQGHTFAQRNGVLALLTPQFAAQLHTFTKAFQADRIAQHYPTLPHTAYAQLPFGAAVRNDPEWRTRQLDLQLILKQLPQNKPARVLDVGAWNGWLSHQLATRGHSVTAVAYFADDQDGLGARKFYPNPQWQAVQLDECDLDVIQEVFDCVILNRCVQFAPDPLKQVQAAQARVAQGGQLIATGLNFFRDPSKQIARTQRRAAAFQKTHGLSLFLRPTRAYLDIHDLEDFQRAGLRVKPYLQLGRALVQSLVQLTSACPCYAIWRR